MGKPLTKSKSKYNHKKHKDKPKESSVQQYLFGHWSPAAIKAFDDALKERYGKNF